MSGYGDGRGTWQPQHQPYGNGYGAPNFTHQQQASYGQQPLQRSPHGQTGSGAPNFTHQQQTGYGQQPLQYPPDEQTGYGAPSNYGHQNHWQTSPSENPPPFTKPRGNTVVTHYPPPPGYKGPAQTGQPYQRPGGVNLPPAGYFSLQHHQGAPTPPDFQHQGAQSISHQQQSSGFPAIQQFHPRQPSLNGYTATQPYTPGQFSRAPPMFAIHSQAQNAPPAHPPWQRKGSGSSSHISCQNSQPALVFDAGIIVDGNGDPVSPVNAAKRELGLSEVDEDTSHPYIYESPFYKEPHRIDPNFSLGEIVSHPALPTKRALPSTFGEAELEALAPMPQKLGEEFGTSQYFVGDKAEEALLSVRQTDHFDEIKDDNIFREYPLITNDIVSMADLKKNWTKREDPGWAPSQPQSRSPSPLEPPPRLEPRPATSSSMQKNGGAEEQVDSSSQLSDSPHQVLECQQFQHDRPTNASSMQFQHEHNGGPNLTSNPIIPRSQQPQYQPMYIRPEPLVPMRDEEQERKLAALGVSGSSKVVYQTLAPARAEDSRASIASTISNAPSRIPSIAYEPAPGDFWSVPPPPPPMERSFSSENVWKTHGYDPKAHNDIAGANRPVSRASSQHTAIGSDFDMDDCDATPRPKQNTTGAVPSLKPTSHGKKRTYEETGGSSESGLKGEDDATPKTSSRKAQRIDPSYERRW